MPATLNGSIEWVTFHNLENGFAVFEVRVRGHQSGIGRSVC